jgi:hypothetical protein
VRRAPSQVVGCVALGVVGAALLAGAIATRRWDLGTAALIVAVGLVAALRSRPMRLAFEVGHQEKHSVVFTFDKFWGGLSVKVDGVPVVRDLRMFSVDLTKSYRFTVGTSEIHDVHIEKDRSRFLAGARAQPVRAYVDDLLVAEGVA